MNAPLSHISVPFDNSMAREIFSFFVYISDDNSSVFSCTHRDMKCN